ncbi:MAG: hypothetical protein F4207_01575, partial [Gemmatimonadetes bacterium]|nr:hypothetical protein [Gemmatimonadota bacterium]
PPAPPPTPPPATVPTSIGITPSSVTLNSFGETIQLTARLQDQNGTILTGATFTWTSGNTGVATVSDQGLVTAVMNGSAVVTARSGSLSAMVNVTVSQTAGRIVIEPQMASFMALGETVQLKAAIQDRNGHPVAGAEVTWSSNDESVATVNGQGLVTAVGNGSATITARSGSASSGISVTVMAPSPDREVLTLLYNATGGPQWIENANWLSEAPLGAWHGVTTNASGRVRKLELSENGLNGQLPVELGNLSYLVRLVLNGNKLEGEIPSSLGQLTNLTSLILTANELTGEIPSELGNLTNLTGLGLSENELTGTIPAELGNLTRLRSLNLEINELTGPVPSTLGNLTDLTYISLNVNRLSGPIPPELGQLGKLEQFRFAGNKFTGTLPPELGQLSRLIDFDVTHSELTGEIPPELGGLSSLVFLTLAGNRFTGRIPPELGRLSNLESIWMQDNELTGPIPREFGNLTRLRDLYLSNNRLTGVIPPELGQLTDLGILFASGNRLSGSIPPELGQLARLKQLSFQGNPEIYGTLPRSLLNLELDALWLNGTQLCAPADVEFQTWLSGIRSVRINNCTSDRDALLALYEAAGGMAWLGSGNWLTDAPLGDWYGVTTNAAGQVSTLVLVDNNMEGSLPPALGDLTGLTMLNLNGNDGLEGPLPRALVNLELDVLDLEGTNLCATDDDEIQSWLSRISDRRVNPCTMAHPDWIALDALFTSTFGQNWNDQGNWLSTRPLDEWHGVTTDDAGRVSELRLEYNNLWGALPPELGQLTHLRVLSIAGNRLTGGEIPAELGDLARLESLRLADNQLRGTIPSDLDRLDALRELDLSNNRLSGGIPGELGDLRSLQRLILRNNSFSSSLPAELGRLTGLTYLAAADNQLAGQLPATLGDLASLNVLELSGNHLSGTVPADLGRLANLESLNLAKNRLTGGIPAALGELTSLVYMSFAENQLTGSLPMELGNLSRLKTLSFVRNSGLTGPLPRSITRLQLDALLLDGTMLCVPSDTDFQMWISDIPNSRVALCVSSMTSAAYLTQAVQSLAYPVPLVAGEPALLRVFVAASDETEATLPPVRVTFYDGGSVVHTMDIPGKDTAIPTEVNEADLESSINELVPDFVIMQGLEMVIEIDPEGTVDAGLFTSARIPSEGRMAVAVRDVPPFDLTLVPFLWTENPDRSFVAEINSLRADDELFRLTRDLLPVGAFELSVRDAWMTSMDPVLDNSIQLLEDIVAVRAMDGAQGHYMGVLTGGGGRAHVPGYTSVSILEEPIIAHELGHNMSLLHNNCGGFFLELLDPNYPNDDGSIDAWGYDLQRGELVHPSVPDLMSYCRPPWISDYNFTKALSFRLNEEAGMLAASATFSKGLLVWGGVDETGSLTLNPAFVVDAPPAVPRMGGPYRLTGFSRNNGTLFSVSFNMARIAHGDGRSFAFVIPVRDFWRENLVRVELSGPEGVATSDDASERAAVLLLDRSTGSVRGILRDWFDGSFDSQSARPILPEPGLDFQVSVGIPDPADWK